MPRTATRWDEPARRAGPGAAVRRTAQMLLAAVVALGVMFAGTPGVEAKAIRKHTAKVYTYESSRTALQGGTFKIRVNVRRRTSSQGRPQGYVRLYVNGVPSASRTVSSAGNAYFAISARYIGRTTTYGRFVPSRAVAKRYLSGNGRRHILTVRPRRMTNLTVEGDSITEGYRDDLVPAQRWAAKVTAHYRVPLRQFAQSGSGYLRVGHGGRGTTFAGRITQVVATRPDTIIVMGGRNDWWLDGRDTTEAEIRTAATRYLAALQRRLPYTRIIVAGPVWGTQGRGVGDLYARRTYTAVRAAAAARRVEFVSTWFGLLNPASQQALNAGGIHPNATGQQLIANRVIAGL